jgi:hypothetical protein
MHPMSETYAPVAMFVYNRPRHTSETLAALRSNSGAPQTDLWVFSDAPKDAASRSAVAETRSLLREIAGFKSVTIVERATNWGLADSIIDGVSQVCQSYGRVIVLEDDLVVSPFFLEFMNQGLEKYVHDERVISIHGYIYPVKDALPETFFLKGADCWGWATWQRGWNLFNPDGAELLNQLICCNLTRQFDFDGNYPYTKMLRRQITGKNNSWAIRWYASAFLADKLTLYPKIPLVRNIGVDGSGDHCSATDVYDSELSPIPIPVNTIDVTDNVSARASVQRFMSGVRLPVWARVKNRLRRYFPRKNR